MDRIPGRGLGSYPGKAIDRPGSGLSMPPIPFILSILSKLPKSRVVGDIWFAQTSFCNETDGR